MHARLQKPVCFLALLAPGVWCGAGCQQARPAGPRLVGEFVASDPGDFERVWDAAERTLRRHFMPPVRVDRVHGEMVGAWATAAQWWEPWRDDLLTPEDRLEANLHTVRRRGVVRIRPAGTDGVYRVEVEVERQRIAVPERQVTRAVGAVQIFSSRVPTMEGQIVPAEEAVRWTPLPPDRHLEREMLGEIVLGSRPVEVRLMEAEEAPPAGEHAPSEVPIAEPPARKTPTAEPSASEAPTAEPPARKTPTVEPAASEAPTAEPPARKTPTVEPAASEPPTAEPAASEPPGGEP